MEETQSPASRQTLAEFCRQAGVQELENFRGVSVVIHKDGMLVLSDTVTTVGGVFRGVRLETTHGDAIELAMTGESEDPSFEFFKMPRGDKAPAVDKQNLHECQVKLNGNAIKMWSTCGTLPL